MARIPIDGGGTCDRCHQRAFRTTPNGWRHVHCETAQWHADRLARQMARTDANRRPRRRKAGSRP